MALWQHAWECICHQSPTKSGYRWHFSGLEQGLPIASRALFFPQPTTAHTKHPMRVSSPSRYLSQHLHQTLVIHQLTRPFFPSLAPHPSAHDQPFSSVHLQSPSSTQIDPLSARSILALESPLTALPFAPSYGINSLPYTFGSRSPAPSPLH